MYVTLELFREPYSYAFFPLSVIIPFFYSFFVLLLNWINSISVFTKINGVVFCLFVWSFSSHSRIFSLIWRRHIAGEGLQIFTYAWHLCKLRSEFVSGAVTTCFNDVGLSLLGFEHVTFRLRGKGCNPLRHRRVCMMCISENI